MWAEADLRRELQWLEAASTNGLELGRSGLGEGDTVALPGRSSLGL